VLIRLTDVLEFLTSIGFWRYIDIPVLDVPYENTVWTNGTIDLDIYENVYWVSINEVGRPWQAHEDTRAIFNQLVAWANDQGLLRPSD
jgi:hypothetical protein